MREAKKPHLIHFTDEARPSCKRCQNAFMICKYDDGIDSIFINSTITSGVITTSGEAASVTVRPSTAAQEPPSLGLPTTLDLLPFREVCKYGQQAAHQLTSRSRTYGCLSLPASSFLVLFTKLSRAHGYSRRSGNVLLELGITSVDNSSIASTPHRWHIFRRAV